ncbi:hypothetical protein NOR_05995 [Metarhizium rileyi]|uniref:Uncharacterized protein n=1 Tax=Metarhizium rileyi (strain RCEF 4871) TaxID=1649241 RepID=A0A167BFX4_METRR|nr:hypothetical protein NOR_05995 [Metarhizium rileyi RCEF 4871]
MASDQIRKRCIANDLSQVNVPLKKPRLTDRCGVYNFSPTFWDNLTKVWLTRRALRELDRRNNLSGQPSERTGLVDVLPDDLARFSRHGGPDLRHLQAYPEPSFVPHNMTSRSSSALSQSQRLQSPKATSASSKTRRSSAYDDDFEQHLIDHDIYPDGYEFPDDRLTPEPCNMDSIQQDLLAARASLSLSRFSNATFRDFKRNNKTNSKGTVMRNVIPIIAGNADIPNEGHLPFTNLRSLIGEATIKPVPDFFDGARPGSLDKAVAKALDDEVRPTKHAGVPIAANFFLEAKARRGGADVAELQARFVGANGSRTMHALQNFKLAKPEYDGKAYSFSSTYHDGTLKLYAHHVAAPVKAGGRLHYHMTQAGAFALTHSRESFVQGAAAFRNARDLAKQYRDDFIRAANTRVRGWPVSVVRVAEGNEQEKITATADDSSKGRREHELPQDLHPGGDLQNPSQASTALGNEDHSISFATSLTSSLSYQLDPSAPGNLPHRTTPGDVARLRVEHVST